LIKAIQNIAIFASGAGSNAGKIIAYFKNSDAVRVSLIVTGNARAGVLEIAKTASIPSYIFDKQYLTKGISIIQTLKHHSINFIVLAGFMWKVPPELIAEWPGKIVNIHPALLPKFGGKGMYGHHVFEAVYAAGEQESGITIHYVDELYDHGQVIFQARFPLSPEDDPTTIGEKTRVLEHTHFPAVIGQILAGEPITGNPSPKKS
jgi:phosphoribosylglycinamide formyltransferase 1